MLPQENFDKRRISENFLGSISALCGNFLGFWEEAFGPNGQTAFQASRGTYFINAIAFGKVGSFFISERWAFFLESFLEYFRQISENFILRVNRNFVKKTCFLFWQEVFFCSFWDFDRVFLETSDENPLSVLFLQPSTYPEERFDEK